MIQWVFGYFVGVALSLFATYVYRSREAQKIELGRPKFYVGQSLKHPYLGDIEVVKVRQSNYSFEYVIKHNRSNIKGNALVVDESTLYRACAEYVRENNNLHILRKP